MQNSFQFVQVRNSVVPQQQSCSFTFKWRNNLLLLLLLLLLIFLKCKTTRRSSNLLHNNNDDDSDCEVLMFRCFACCFTVLLFCALSVLFCKCALELGKAPKLNHSYEKFSIKSWSPHRRHHLLLLLLSLFFQLKTSVVRLPYLDVGR